MHVERHPQREAAVSGWTQLDSRSDARVRTIRVPAASHAHQRRFDSPFQLAAKPLLDALLDAGIDPTDFGTFGCAGLSTFDFSRAAPVIVEWLPRVADKHVKDAMVRSLADQPAARGEGTVRRIEEFGRPEYPGSASLKWTIGNTVSTLATLADADAIVAVLLDRKHGDARQMFCDALARTRDPGRIDILIKLISDDDVAGHAIVALRQCGYRRRVPESSRVRPLLEALLDRPTASVFAKRQARKALTAMAFGRI